jgi:hypothetical protein
MFRVSPVGTLVVFAALAAVPALATPTHHGAHARPHATHRGRKAAKAHTVRGQREIDPARATEIQTALIREHYLDGAPSGQWDAETEAAMQKYQADHGWQTRLTPDSRALIKLGLGPNGGANTAVAEEPTPARSASPAPNDVEPGTLAAVHAISN